MILARYDCKKTPFRMVQNGFAHGYDADFTRPHCPASKCDQVRKRGHCVLARHPAKSDAMLYSLIRPALFTLDPERAHGVAIGIDVTLVVQLPSGH